MLLELVASKLTLWEPTQGEAREGKKRTTYVDALQCDSLANSELAEGNEAQAPDVSDNALFSQFCNLETHILLVTSHPICTLSGTDPSCTTPIE